mmetsp:Transcript_33465/g.77836  ORF Transcript_33465/g.77836 Transcript_33465/m.77836 type:complete len:103 (-) Transcript_33465:1320-1628(-)
MAQCNDGAPCSATSIFAESARRSSSHSQEGGTCANPTRKQPSIEWTTCTTAVSARRLGIHQADAGRELAPFCTTLEAVIASLATAKGTTGHREGWTCEGCGC